MNKIAILGGGESGVGTAILAKDKGLEVWLSDAKAISEKYKTVLEEENIPFEENGHTVEKFFEADVIVKSPGIPEKAEIIQALRKENKRIVSEIEFASWFTDSKIVGITGSNGKTTTASLIYHLLKKANYDVGLGGNIGQSFAYLVARKPAPLYVLEISSFQLDDLEKFRPDIAILLNITEDHLDRYEYKIENYAASKFNIGKYQKSSDIFIYNLDDKITLQEMPKYPLKAFLQGFSLEKKTASVMYQRNEKVFRRNLSYNLSSMQIVGKHNAYNTMAAIMAVTELGMKREEIQLYLSSFKAIEHRIEKVAEKEGVTYINDSKATNVDSTWYALECMKQPIVWIAGGIDKGNDYSSLTAFAKEKVKALIILGPYKDKLATVFQGIIPEIHFAASMQEAVALSTKAAQKGDCVLLSPCCASFDLFKNYEDRGKQFKSFVMNNE